MIAALGLSKLEYGMVEQSFGCVFGVGTLLFGVVVSRVCTYWLDSVTLLPWFLRGVLTGFAAIDAPLPSGTAAASLLIWRTLPGLFEAGHWPCAVQTRPRMLAAADRTVGNRILQSGTLSTAIVTPLLGARMLSAAESSWRRPFLLDWRRRGRMADLGTSLQQQGRDYRFWLLALVVSCVTLTVSTYRVWIAPGGAAQTGVPGIERAAMDFHWMRASGIAGARVEGCFTDGRGGKSGSFPGYHALTQELSNRERGLVTGLLSSIGPAAATLQRPPGVHIDL